MHDSDSHHCDMLHFAHQNEMLQEGSHNDMQTNDIHHSIAAGSRMAFALMTSSRMSHQNDIPLNDIHHNYMEHQGSL
jgi:hypothetical protein